MTSWWPYRDRAARDLGMSKAGSVSSFERDSQVVVILGFSLRWEDLP